MNSTNVDYDVAIIGYGPSGVAAANALGAAGVSVVVYERNLDIYARARAVTVNDWTMRIFQDLGLRDETLKHMDPTTALRWKTYEGQKLMDLPFPDGPYGYHTAYSIYQPGVEQALRDGVKRFDNAEVKPGVELIAVEQDDDGAAVKTRDLASGESSEVRVKYVLACHGGERVTREILDVELVGDTLEQRWIIIDGKVKRWWPERHILTFWSDKEKPVVDIGLGRDNHRWEIPLKPGEDDTTYDTEEKVWPLLEDLGVTRDDVDIHGWAFYNHHVRHAEQWRMGKVILVGDAAHLMPPWAGSGMQSGIRDAANIAWKLVYVLRGQLPEAVLDTYQTERQPNVDFYTGVSVQLGQIIKQELPEEEVAALAASEDLPPLLWPPTYPAGWFTGISAPEGFPDEIVGTMIPQPRAANVKGLIAPLDEILGNGFVLLGDGIDPRDVLSSEEIAGWDQVDAEYRAVLDPSQRSERPNDVIDIDGELAAWMRSYGVKVIAVRPDRFVAAADITGLAVPS